MQDIPCIAHNLGRATTASESSSPRHPFIWTSDSPVVIDSINLPTPPPLLLSLHEAGVNFQTASAVNQVYQRHAEQLKQRIQECITTACHKAAEFPAFTSVLSPDLLMKKLTSIFTEVYVRRLEEWKEETFERIKQASKAPVKAAPRNSRTFNHEYIPLLEHFFEENPFPTHSDKAFLAKKSNMQYRQIHVWFQNRRNRTKKEVKLLNKKPIYQAAAKLPDKLYECMKGYMVNSGFTEGRKPFTAGSSERTTEVEATWNNVRKDAFASSAPSHAFPSPYPPTCHYDPFPCKGGPVHFSKSEWRREPCGKPPLFLPTNIDDLVEKFSRLNVRDGTRYKGSSKLQSQAATAAITVIPSRAPHPSLIACKYLRSTNIVQHYPSVRVPVSRSKTFQSTSPASKPVTLVPLSVPPNNNQPPRKRKTAPLPQRFPSRTRRDITSSGSSSTSPSPPPLSSTDSESRRCSFSSVSPLSTPSDVASIQEFLHLFASS